jgi:hypothetical protein
MTNYRHDSPQVQREFENVYKLLEKLEKAHSKAVTELYTKLEKLANDITILEQEIANLQ